MGYGIISEAPFTADATDAINPAGPNLLAVAHHESRRQAGLDGLSFDEMGKIHDSSHARVRRAGGRRRDAGPRASERERSGGLQQARSTISSPAGRNCFSGPAYDGPISFTITRDGNVYYQNSQVVHVPPGGTLTIATDATVVNCQLWDINQPNLYEASASLPSVAHSDRSTTFGFRWLEAKGLGADAKLYLNRRIVPRSSISWGFWAPNGIFPDGAAVQREVAAVMALGLDSIQNHRHMPKAVALDAFDRAGLLRYCEAGGGLFTFQDAVEDAPGPTVPTDTTGKGRASISSIATSSTRNWR